MDDINNHSQLSEDLYETQVEFYTEEVDYRDISNESIQSNKTKKSLHEILTNVIFTFSLCIELLNAYKRVKRPTADEWGQDLKNKWTSLIAEPFHHVSNHIFKNT